MLLHWVRMSNWIEVDIQQEFQFISDSTHHTGYQSKAVKFTRTLCRKQIILIERFEERNDVISINSSDSEDRTIRTTKRSGRQTCAQGSSSRIVGAKKRSFDLFACVDSISNETKRKDEVSRYSNLSLDYIWQALKSFLENEFSVMNFWYNRKTQFPQLFATATRVYPKPVSSSLVKESSLLKLLFNDKRSRLCTSILDYMIALRSLHDC